MVHSFNSVQFTPLSALSWEFKQVIISQSGTNNSDSLDNQICTDHTFSGSFFDQSVGLEILVLRRDILHTRESSENPLIQASKMGWQTLRLNESSVDCHRNIVRHTFMLCNDCSLWQWQFWLHTMAMQNFKQTACPGLISYHYSSPIHTYTSSQGHMHTYALGNTFTHAHMDTHVCLGDQSCN